MRTILPLTLIFTLYLVSCTPKSAERKQRKQRELYAYGAPPQAVLVKLHLGGWATWKLGKECFLSNSDYNSRIMTKVNCQ